VVLVNVNVAHHDSDCLKDFEKLVREYIRAYNRKREQTDQDFGQLVREHIRAYNRKRSRPTKVWEQTD
jgi:hypothetical protein